MFSGTIEATVMQKLLIGQDFCIVRTQPKPQLSQFLQRACNNRV